MPRTSKRTPERVKKICDLLRNGNTRKTAFTLAGISHETFARWLSNREFRELVENAEEEAVARNVAMVVSAGKKNWQAAAWWLERRRPDEFGSVQKIQARLERMTDEELIEAAASIIGRAAGP